MNNVSTPSLTSTTARRLLYEAQDSGPADEALLRAAQCGDAGALERLLSGRERPLYLLCYGILGRREDAEDAVQETFLRAVRALHGFRGETGVKAWLTRIAVNVCLEQKRRHRTRREVGSEGAEVEPQCASPEGEVLERLSVFEALASVPPRGRAILLLKEREGWTTREIARATRRTERQVYYELQKAYRALADWRSSHPEE